LGRDRARREYAATVVLCRSFWLQSTSTRPTRRSLRMLEVTCEGRWAAMVSATWREKDLVSSNVTSVWSGT
jgi:hypothetical protein